MTSRASSSSARSSSGLRLFNEEERTDMVIRVRVNSDTHRQPAAKRRRGAAAAATDAADDYTDIPAHSLVLCASSAYFDKALSGEWTEAAERRVELTVEDEQELADLRLLIKLSYSDSFTHDDGQLLPLTTRLRLAVRADALEFVEALDQLVASLSEGLSYEEAQALLDGLPPAVKQHAGMAAVRSNVAAVLADGIKEREGKAGKKQELKAGVAALAKCLGPVAGMFEATDKLVNGSLPLREEVKKLPFAAPKGLLKSEALELQLENEAYALLKAWLRQSPDVSGKMQRRALFNQLAPLLRYHHMTPSFLASAVAQCPLMERSGLLPNVMSAALAQRDVRPTLLKKEEVETGLPTRGASPSKGCWEVKACFSLEEVKALEPEGYISKWVGLVAGYPAALEVERETDRLGCNFRVLVHEPEDSAPGSPAVGVCLATEWTLSPDISVSASNFYTGECWGWGNLFGKPWAEAVCEGSPHFPGGTLEVKITAKLANQKS